jgi:hypothetical protein
MNKADRLSSSARVSTVATDNLLAASRTGEAAVVVNYLRESAGTVRGLILNREEACALNAPTPGNLVQLK